jgi:hypothetical protein
MDRHVNWITITMNAPNTIKSDELQQTVIHDHKLILPTLDVQIVLTC